MPFHLGGPPTIARHPARGGKMTGTKKSKRGFPKDHLMNLVWADYLVEALPDHNVTSQDIHVSSLKRMWEELERDWAVQRPTKSVSRQVLDTGENRFGPVVESREMVAPPYSGTGDTPQFEAG